MASRGKLSPATYGYRVNLHERGEFSADVVEDDGHELYQVRSDPDDESIVHEIDDGWMRHTGDLVGLTDYLVHLGIIAAGSRILPMSQAEAQWEQSRTRTNPLPRFSRWNTVRVGADEIHAFKRRWPASGLPDDVDVFFEFDRHGLVDIQWSDGQDHEDADGSALVALAQDAQDGKIGSFVPHRGAMKGPRKRTRRNPSGADIRTKVAVSKFRGTPQAFIAAFGMDVARRVTYVARGAGWDQYFVYTLHEDRTLAHERQNRSDNSVRMLVRTE